MDRLATALLTLALVAHAGCAIARADSPAARVHLQPIAENVWLHASYQDVPPWGPILSQGLAIRTAAGVLLVDTAWNDADTERLLALARDAAGAPVSAVVVTHAHADKMGGLGATRAAGIRSYAHPWSNADAPGRGLGLASEILFAEGGDSQTVAGVEVFYPGAGHSRDNLVVYYAPARVLFGGCLVRPGRANDLGNTADADVGHWADAVRAVRARFPDAGIVVPSHGQVGGPELLEHTIELAEAAVQR